MKIAILGTGPVGQTFAGALSSKGHAVKIGTRDLKATMARNEKDLFGNPPFKVWREQNPKVDVGTFAEAAQFGELVINCLSGQGAIEGLTLAGEQNLAGKILIDISNPLDFSKGMPPSLFISNTDSLGEQVQKRFPKTRVVKALNTLNAYLMVGPGQLAGGDHTSFVCGNDEQAKGEVMRNLKEWFGWKDLIDLGDITNARGTEQYVALWVRMFGALKTPMFSIKVVR
jgi:predicted dinucleotide-binding enzyme